MREIKVKVDINDTSANQLIELLAEGERHYRIATGRRPAPSEWAGRAGDWRRAAMAGGPEGVIVLVKLAPPTPGEIIEGLESLARRVYATTGLTIPTDEFQ